MVGASLNFETIKRPIQMSTIRLTAYSSMIVVGILLLAGSIVLATRRSARAQLLYGLGCGALTVAFRYYGLFPEGVTYAILLMNACAWSLDRLTPPKRFGTVKGGTAQ